MKTKISLAVALGVLFVAVPSATPKGHPPAAVPGAIIACSENGDGITDTCMVSFTGMDPGTTYHITISDTCGGDGIDTSRSGSSSYSFTFTSLKDCATGLVISVTSGTGRKATPVIVNVTGDTGSV